MNVILIVVQIVASIALIGLILMQQGKGADAGASFGAGASQTFFGSAGSANAVTKLTALFATIFFIASLGLAYVAQEDDRSGLQKELSEQLAPAAGDAANTGLAPVAEETSAPADAANEGLAPVAEEAQAEAPVVEADSAPEAEAVEAVAPATEEAKATEEVEPKAAQ